MLDWFTLLPSCSNPKCLVNVTMIGNHTILSMLGLFMIINGKFSFLHWHLHLHPPLSIVFMLINSFCVLFTYFMFPPLLVTLITICLHIYIVCVLNWHAFDDFYYGHIDRAFYKATQLCHYVEWPLDRGGWGNWWRWRWLYRFEQWISSTRSSLVMVIIGLM